jgi:hypothetical protein
MNRTISIAPVRKTVVVETTPQRAFDVFTAGIDRWWPKSKGIGAAPIRESIIEPFEGGRWYTKFEDGTEAVVGHVLVWRPGERFVVSWEISARAMISRSRRWAPVRRRPPSGRPRRRSQRR